MYDHSKMGGENFVDPQQTANYVLDCPEGAPTLVAGDVKIVISTPKGKLTQFWFHTGFVNDNYLCFEKMVLDKACKDKEHYDTNFKVEIFMEKLEEAMERERQGQEAPEAAVVEAVRSALGTEAGAEAEADPEAEAERMAAQAKHELSLSQQVAQVVSPVCDEPDEPRPKATSRRQLEMK
mgnify:CR=1 FL=1